MYRVTNNRKGKIRAIWLYGQWVLGVHLLTLGWRLIVTILWNENFQVWDSLSPWMWNVVVLNLNRLKGNAIIILHNSCALYHLVAIFLVITDFNTLNASIITDLGNRVYNNKMRLYQKGNLDFTIYIHIQNHWYERKRPVRNIFFHHALLLVRTQINLPWKLE